MTIDFSIFQNNENLLFILIIFLIVLVALAIVVFIIVSVFKLIKETVKKIFFKNEDLEYDRNFDVVVPELEESRQEREKIAEKQQEFGKDLTHAPKMQYMDIKKPSEENTAEKDQKQAFDKKEKKDIEEGLVALKKSAKGEKEEESTVFSKIKIPVSKKFATGGTGAGGGKTVAEKDGGPAKDSNIDQEGLDEKNGATGAEKSYQPVSSGKESIIQQNRMEMLKGSEIKIPREKIAERAFGAQKDSYNTGEKISSEIHEDALASRPNSNTKKDDSIFSGKSEVSRIDLRQKLGGDPKVWLAEKQVGLTLNSAERGKLEKEVFPQTYGRNISKTDLKWGIKKLNQKMLNTKDSAEKGKIRKEIKFFKKIGGIK